MIYLDSQTVSIRAEFWSVIRGLMDLYAYQNLFTMTQEFVRYDLKTKVHRIYDFSVDYYHPSYQKVVFVNDVKICNMVNVLPLDNTLDAIMETLAPLCASLLPSHINNT